MAQKTLLVCGDTICDVHLYKGRREHASGRETPGTQIEESIGGAGYLWRVLGALNTPGDNAARLEFLPSQNPGDYPLSHRSFALWESCGKPAVWRMTERLGYGGAADDAPTSILPPTNASGSGTKADVIVIDDGALGFRNQASTGVWPKALSSDSDKPWVVLKISAPLCAGDLWHRVVGSHAEKTVLIVSVEELRREQARITQGISWERTVTDVIDELCNNPQFESLCRCRYLVCVFGREGALVVSRTGDQRKFSLVFDCGNVEGDWSHDLLGNVPGSTAVLTAAVATGVLRLAETGDAGEIGRSAASGLELIRAALRAGRGPADRPPSDPWLLADRDAESPLANVLSAVSSGRGSSVFAEVDVPIGARGIPDTSWTIMQSEHGLDGGSGSPLYGVGYRVARLGPDALTDIPYQRFGKLFTVDRSEIEGLRNLQRMIRRYEQGGASQTPMSVAVFGSPGSGKSFGVKQIARAVLHGDAALLTFNLSQFEGPADLIGALHQVRDAALSGHTPLVFWDEFDSDGYKWLQYLLAPMQDGQFQEGQITHPIGKSIFVFAGGTSYDYENFGPDPEDAAAFKEFKLRKGPDFKSRLAGYLNVLGPNRRQIFDRGRKDWVDDPSDICFPVRRALLMRVLLGYFDNRPLDIDQGLLTAFIELGRYRHGARSMEKILSGFSHQHLRKSDLPPAEVMELHADYTEFMSLIDRSTSFQKLADQVAPKVHEFYLSLAEREGWTPTYSQPYKELPEDVKGDNRAAAMRIPYVLSLIGLRVLPKRAGLGQANGRALDRKDLAAIFARYQELLAEAEHDGWMAYKQRNGWRYGDKRNDDVRIHHLLVRYAELSETEKNKDRENVRRYPEILDLAGYEIVQP